MSALDRSTRPESGPIRRFDFPPVERRALSNGLDLRVARLSRLPVVSVDLFMRGGESALSGEDAGLAVLAADALEGGTDRRSGTELAEALESLGARLGANAGWEGTSLSLYCLADRLPEALGLLAEMVQQPAFPAQEVERVRDQQLAGLRQRAMDPSSLASDAAVATYFAEGVPYARPLDGSVASVATKTREDLAAYASGWYRPEGGGMVVVGDVDVAEVAALAEEHLGSWRGAPPEVDPFEVAPASRERRVIIVDRPGSVQSEIRVGHVGVERTTPDYLALLVANMVLGGTFTSRLNLNLRERHGFTYGVRSRFAFRSRPGPFGVSTAVGNEVTADAVREIVAELEKLTTAGPTEEEVAAVRDFAAGVFGLQLETAGQIATKISQLLIYGLPDGYFRDYRDAIRSVSVAEAAEAARAHVRPAEAQIVVVGAADAVAESLDALRLGPVEIRAGQRAR